MLTDDLFYGTKKYHKKFVELCAPLQQYLGINTAGYMHVDHAGKMEHVHTNYQWMERFIEKNYFKQDPGLVHPNNMSSGFTFVSTSEDQDYRDTMLREAIDEFNFHHGFCYVEKAHSSFNLFYFATQKANDKIFNKIVNEVFVVKKLIRNLNKQITLEFKDLQENKVDMLALKGDLFLKQQGIVFHGQQENRNKIKILQQAGLMDYRYDDLELVKLSKQEINCLRLYMENYSIKQVAIDLNLGITTVITHIETIKQKLACCNKQELLKKADLLVGLGKI